MNAGAVKMRMPLAIFFEGALGDIANVFVIVGGVVGTLIPLWYKVMRPLARRMIISLIGEKGEQIDGNTRRLAKVEKALAEALAQNAFYRGRIKFLESEVARLNQLLVERNSAIDKLQLEMKSEQNRNTAVEARADESELRADGVQARHDLEDVDQNQPTK